MSFAKGIADAMVANRAAEAESAAAQAESRADSLQRELFSALREAREWKESTWLVVGEREGFTSLVVGLHHAARMMLPPDQQNEFLKQAISKARSFIENEVKENQKPHAKSSWLRHNFKWNVDYCLFEMKNPGPEPEKPTPPKEIQVIKAKIFFIIPFRKYKAGNKIFLTLKSAKQFHTTLQDEHQKYLNQYTLLKEKISAYKQQQANIKKYDL